MASCMDCVALRLIGLRFGWVETKELTSNRSKYSLTSKTNCSERSSP